MMLASMTPQQFDEWCAKDAIEPIGQAGVTALLAVIGGMLGSFGSHSFKPEDIKQACLIDGQNWRPLNPNEEREMTTAEILAAKSLVAGA